MSQEGFKRKLTAILSADVIGYSRLMRDDEEATVRDLAAHRVLITEIIQQQHGRIVDSPGDNILAEFASVVDAVNGAIRVQDRIKETNNNVPDNRRMEFRIGINLGDVIEEEERIYGDGVNIAARVEGLAAAGGISISGTVYEHIKDKLSLGYHYLGEQNVKNISEPVKVYRLLTEPADVGKMIGEEKPKAIKWRWMALGLITIIFIIIGTIVVWNYDFRTDIEPASINKMAFQLPDKPSIAVLPFNNMSGDPEQEYFADGMTEDLITDLSQMSGLFVIARNSTFVYKGKAIKISQVAEDLGVRYVLEGSVRKAGKKVRINAQLIDATTGHHMWAKRFDGKTDDVFALQDSITQKIISALTVKLTKSEQSQITKKETDKIEAYDAFLMGWSHYLRFTPSDFTQAISNFEKAIELDPNYARAYAGLARTYEEITALRWHSDIGINWVEASLKARHNLRKAMKSPTSIAYAVAAVLDLKRHQYDRAVKHAERAIALDPNDPSCYAAMGRVLIFSGRAKEAVVFLEIGKRLDPQNPGLYLHLLGWAHFFMERYEQAVIFIERANKHNPEARDWELLLAATYGHLGRTQEANSIMDSLITYVQYDWFALIIDQSFPFRNQEDTNRFYGGLYKAGLPISRTFYGLYEENKLTQKDIKGQFFGRKILESAPSWTESAMFIDISIDGSASYKQGSSSGIGKCWMDGDLVCYKWENMLEGHQYCASVFHNPKDDPTEKFLKAYDFGIRPFTPIK